MADEKISYCDICERDGDEALQSICTSCNLNKKYEDRFKMSKSAQAVLDKLGMSKNDFLNALKK